MNKKILTTILITAAVLLILGVVRFWTPEDDWICANGEWVKHGNPSIAKPSELCPNAQKSEANIIVESPISNQTIGKYLSVKGTARVFENQFNWVVLDAKTQKEITSGSAYANSKDTGLFGSFEINTILPDIGTDKIILQIFDYSAKDGTKQDIVEISLNFDKNLKDNYEVYFSNNNLDPEATCIKVFPVFKPINNEGLNLQKILETLLEGVNSKDKEKGYFTSIPESVKIKSIKISKESVAIDFSKEMENGVGGSCRVTAIRAQIVKTVLAFDKNIKSVIISVEGNSESSLQP